jgi:uncharacterized membrane protein YeaQ/YmgE (transglycosylase-associated protein family)
VEELVDYLRMLRLHSLPRHENQPNAPPAPSFFGQLVQRVLLGSLAAFVGGIIYMFLSPAGDVWQVVIPAFFGPILVVELFSTLRRKQ